MLDKVLALIWKDLLVEARRPLEVVSASIFAVTAASFAGYVASKHAINEYMLQVVGGSSLILIQLFLAIFTAVMGFVREADRGTLHGLRSSPVSSEMIFFSKLVFILLVLEALSFIAIASFTFFSGAPLRVFNFTLLVISISGVYFSAVAAFSSALAVFLEARSLIIPTMVLALSAPYAQNVISMLVAYSDVRMLVLLTASGLFLAVVVTWLSQFIFD